MFEQFCIYHKDLPVTNFCRTVSCSMPLCPECMNDHYELHQNSKESPQIEKISQTYQDVQKIIRQLYSSFRENYQNLKEFYVYRGSMKSLSQQVAEHKQKITLMINAFFDSIEADVNVLQSNETNYLEHQLMIVEQFIKEKNNEIDNITRKVDGPKGLKYMIQILTNNFVQTSKQDSIKCNQFIKSLANQQLSILPCDNKLYDLNIEISKLIKIENKDFYSNLNPNIFSSDEKKDIHPLGRFSDMRSPYQYSQNQSALMDSNYLVQIQQGNNAPVSIKNNAPLSQSSLSYYSFPENQELSYLKNHSQKSSQQIQNYQQLKEQQLQQQEQSQLQKQQLNQKEQEYQMQSQQPYLPQRESQQLQQKEQLKQQEHHHYLQQKEQHYIKQQQQQQEQQQYKQQEQQQLYQQEQQQLSQEEQQRLYQQYKQSQLEKYQQSSFIPNANINNSTIVENQENNRSIHNNSDSYTLQNKINQPINNNNIPLHSQAQQDSHNYVLFPNSQVRSDKVLNQINPTHIPSQNNYIQMYK